MTADMMRGAHILVRTCAGVRAGEDVLVVCDPAMSDIGEVVARAARDRGAEVVVVIMDPRGTDAGEPPRPVAEAMRAADVVFTPVSVSITHSDAVHRACAAGARVVAMTGFTRRMMRSGGITADFRRLAPVVERVADLFTAGRSLRLTTPPGTDLTADISGRRGVAKTCIVGPGDFSPVPDVEAAVAPVEGSARGVIVADASIPYLGIGLLSEPVVFRVEDGMIISARGGEAAERLLAAWKSQNDPAVYNVAEVGVGLNPESSLTGEMLEDEGTWGTVHIGTGANVTLGGLTRAASHYDLLMFSAVLSIDDEDVLRGGQLVGLEREMREAGLRQPPG
ncbi:MAG: leucyl aminopeptidase [Bacillota bacterium]